METFRCPTCVGVLPDAYARRCGTCGQGLHRRRSRAPKVLGDDRRLAGKQLPVDRWMLERLYGEHRRKRTQVTPVAWHGRFVPSPASAEPDVQRPPIMEPPAPNFVEPSLRQLGEEIDALADLAPADVSESLVIDGVLIEEPAPATVDALHLDMFVAPPPPEPVTPRPIVTHELLDPEVRALVDELYEQARAEMSGLDVSFDEPPAPVEIEPAVAPAPVPEPELRLPEPPEPPAPPPPSGPSARATSAVGTVIPQSNPTHDSGQSRSGWVPAFIADDQNRRITE